MNIYNIYELYFIIKKLNIILNIILSLILLSNYNGLININHIINK